MSEYGKTKRMRAWWHKMVRSMFPVVLCVFLLVMGWLDWTQADTLPSLDETEPLVQVFVSPVSPGEDFRVFFRNTPGHKKDWIGLFQLDALDDAVLDRRYLPRMIEGDISFPAPEEEGFYEFRLFIDGSGAHLVRSNVVEVLADRDLDVTGWVRRLVAGVSLEVPENWLVIPPEEGFTGWYHEGGSEPDMVFTFTYHHSIEDALHEVDVFEHGEAILDGRPFIVVTGSLTDDVYRNWFWFSTEKLGKGGHLCLGGVAFTAFRFRAEPVFTHMVESLRFDEATDELGEAITLSLFPRTVSQAGKLTVTVSGAPGRERDWVGLYRLGAAHEEYLAWRYLLGETNLSLVFSVPLQPGEYECRLFTDDSFFLLATSNPVNVQEKIETP